MEGDTLTDNLFALAGKSVGNKSSYRYSCRDCQDTGIRHIITYKGAKINEVLMFGNRFRSKEVYDRKWYEHYGINIDSINEQLTEGKITMFNLTEILEELHKKKDFKENWYKIQTHAEPCTCEAKSKFPTRNKREEI